MPGFKLNAKPGCVEVAVFSPACVHVAATACLLEKMPDISCTLPLSLFGNVLDDAERVIWCRVRSTNYA